MKNKISRFLPLGVDAHSFLVGFGVCLAASVLYSFLFLGRLANAYGELFYVDISGKHIFEGALMPDFVELLKGTLSVFWLTGVAVMLSAVFLYATHFQGSKSIYLMRRLPKKNELFFRCVPLPVLAGMLIWLMAIVMLLLYFVLYLKVTPSECLQPGQWQKLWGEIL